jgi:hypothetical protein
MEQQVMMFLIPVKLGQVFGAQAVVFMIRVINLKCIMNQEKAAMLKWEV